MLAFAPGDEPVFPIPFPPLSDVLIREFPMSLCQIEEWHAKAIAKLGAK